MQSIPQICFRSYFQNKKIFLFGKKSIFPFRKNHPLSENTKFKLSLCMSLVFGASRNISFNYNNHIFKLFTKGFENLLSCFFFNSENLLSSIGQCTCLHLYFLFGKFHLHILNKMADNMVLPFHMKQILILVKTVFVELIYLSGDLRLSIAISIC